jgi:uncharacterized damage-inducible protein DinB
MASLPALIDAYLVSPQRVRQAVTGLTREQLQARPGPCKWSTLEVVCHLADSEQAWIHRMKRVIAEEKPLLIGYDESRFAEALAYHDRDLEEELHAIDEMRKQFGRILRTLPVAALSRQGVHNERGLMSLGEMIQIEIDHLLHHLKFIEAKRQKLVA